MTVKDELQAAAVEIFNSFGSLIINATYIQDDPAYVPGGNLSSSATEYSVRLLRDERRAELALATDIPRDALKYMMVTAELPIAAKIKDRIRVGTDVKSIIAVDTDPADAITLLWVG
ncbi:MAG: hypothetical protein OEQ39_00105 [Gammaproteobacteria bacterium]|nr:hypothetical protein [Gammaproteobacteria bacterium]